MFAALQGFLATINRLYKAAFLIEILRHDFLT
jgi:hypothetical protein